MWLGYEVVAKQAHTQTQERDPSVTVTAEPAGDKPSVRAAVLLWASSIAQELNLEEFPATGSEAIACAGSGRSQAYEVLGRLQASAAELFKSAGRPAASAPAAQTALQLCAAVRDFVMLHGGCVRGRGARRTYSDAFRRFVVELFAPQGLARCVTVEQAADAIGVPVGTLKDWLSTPTSSASRSQPTPGAEQAPHSLDPLMRCAQPQIATLLTEYEAWQGDLSSFCVHAREHLGLPFGRAFITNVLAAAGLYETKPRNAPHQTPCSRGSMKLLFPGMQWFGDGKQLRVIIDDHNLLFNIEALVDGASNAAVAARVTDAEDAAAVVGAFNEGLQTTAGQPPLAVTLDNRPSNFAPEIDAALSCTELLRSTPGRGQAKAPVEGSFGLFEQSLPGAIVVEGGTIRDRARSIAQWIVHAFFLGRNGKPRGKLGGHSPAQAYDNSSPADEQIDAARRWILELRRREQIARESRERHADPVRLQLLREQLAALEIDDPQGQASLSLSAYSMGAIVRGIAVFRAKREMGALPAECDPYRYLAGIIANTESREALERTAHHLLKLRQRAGDLHLAPLMVRADAIRQSKDADCAVRDFVDAALDARSLLDFRFWTAQARDGIAAMPVSQARALYPHLTRVIAACFGIERRWRETLISSIARAVAPVAA